MTTLHVRERRSSMRAVGNFPAIRALDVESDLPHKLRIRVLEHRPVAVLEAPRDKPCPSPPTGRPPGARARRAAPACEWTRRGGRGASRRADAAPRARARGAARGGRARRIEGVRVTPRGRGGSWRSELSSTAPSCALGRGGERAGQHGGTARRRVRSPEPPPRAGGRTSTSAPPRARRVGGCRPRTGRQRPAAPPGPDPARSAPAEPVSRGLAADLRLNPRSRVLRVS